MDEEKFHLLAVDEAPAVSVHNEGGQSPFLIVADHAGNRIPRSLDMLGLPARECLRHIAWDIGVSSVSRCLADMLEATLVQQNYSRLIIDCNRPLGSESSIPEFSDLTHIPGNSGLSADRQAVRAQEIFKPYHDRIEAEVDRLQQADIQPVLVAMHSFTPVFMGDTRPWHAGVLYNRDRRFARTLLGIMKQEAGLCVGDNEPYSVSDLTDYTIPVHGEGRGLLHVEIEVRQDLIEDAYGQQTWAARLADWLPQALEELGAVDPH
jgi:predicted N-formylglutamate amidohydrolase